MWKRKEENNSDCGDMNFDSSYDWGLEGNIAGWHKQILHMLARRRTKC